MPEARRGAAWFMHFMGDSEFRGNVNCGTEEGPAGDVTHVAMSYTYYGEKRYMIIRPDVRNGQPVLVITEDWNAP